MNRFASRAAFLLAAHFLFSVSSFAQRAESWKAFPRDLLADQKRIWLFPRELGRGRRWVPWVAYGLATLVGFSRISLQAHFPSDVFAGAVLGHLVSRYVVLRGP